MRLKIVLNSSLGVRLPRNSQEIIHNFILETADVSNKNFQNFNFSSPKGNFDVNPDKSITYYGEFSFFVSSKDTSFIHSIFDNLGDTVMFNGSEINVVSKNITDFKINFKRYTIKTISPACVYEFINGKTTFYNPNDEKFFEIIKKNIKQNYPDIENMELTFSNVDRVKKIITRYKDFVIEGYLFECKVEGSKEAIEAIYNDGIGNRTFQGFGMMLLGF